LRIQSNLIAIGSTNGLKYYRRVLWQERSMPITKVTRKGQITIPIEIRKELDIREGDHLLVRKEDDKIILQNNRDWVTRTAGIFKEYAVGMPALTDEDIDQASADAAIERYDRAFEQQS
jgi:AbrB family looped-hinge helix DNA binding protein